MPLDDEPRDPGGYTDGCFYYACNVCAFLAAVMLVGVVIGLCDPPHRYMVAADGIVAVLFGVPALACRWAASLQEREHGLAKERYEAYQEEKRRSYYGSGSSRYGRVEEPPLAAHRRITGEALSDIRDPQMRSQVEFAQRAADMATVQASVAASDALVLRARLEKEEADLALREARAQLYAAEAREALAKAVRDKVLAEPESFVPRLTGQAAGLLPSGEAFGIEPPAMPVLTPEQAADLVVAAAAENGDDDALWMKWGASVSERYPDQAGEILDAAARLRRDGSA